MNAIEENAKPKVLDYWPEDYAKVLSGQEVYGSKDHPDEMNFIREYCK